MKSTSVSYLAMFMIAATGMGGALFIFGGATGMERVAYAGAVLMLPASIFFGAIVAAIAIGYALAMLVRAMAALAFALRRCRPR